MALDAFLENTATKCALLIIVHQEFIVYYCSKPLQTSVGHVPPPNVTICLGFTDTRSDW